MALAEEPAASAALTTTCSGAASASVGAVYIPAVSTVPTVSSLPSGIPFTLQVTTVPAGATENHLVPPRVMTAESGETVINGSSSPWTAQPDNVSSNRHVNRAILNLESN